MISGSQQNDCFRRVAQRLASAALLWLCLLPLGAPATAAVPLTDLGLMQLLENSLRARDAQGLRELHNWTGVTGRYELLSNAYLRRLLSLDITNLYLEHFVVKEPTAGLSYNIEPSATATVEFVRPNGQHARIRLPFGERDGRLYLAMLVGNSEKPAQSAMTGLDGGFLLIDIRAERRANTVDASYDIACVVDTDKGEQTVTYTASGGSIKRLSGRRFRSCGMRVITSSAPPIEMRLQEGERVVYRSGRVQAPDTVVYRPRT